ncbi:MAG: hypothetical protein AAGF24_05730 [Cyanobacteria bacterium P01_H01_bin.121]
MGPLKQVLQKLSGKDNFYLVLDESSSSTQANPTPVSPKPQSTPTTDKPAKSEVTAVTATQAPPQPKQSKQSKAKNPVAQVQPPPPAPAPSPAEPAENPAKLQEAIASFQAMTPKFPTRRRPGPSLDMFAEMARTMR